MWHTARAAAPAFMQFNSQLRRIALVLIPLMLAACSRAVEVPREQIEPASRNESDTHRIVTTPGETYLAEQFSVTDSTLTIDKLSPSDTAHRDAAVPISFPFSEIQSVHRIETRPPTYLAFVGVGLFIVAVAVMASGEGFTD